jgi:hypothetical protein
VTAPSGRFDRQWVRALPWLLAALPFAVLALRVLWSRHDPVYSGDPALLELAVRSAGRGTRAVGPYSRFDFFHPGPIMFYVLNPFERITQGAPWALPLGVNVFNGVAAATFVRLVQRRNDVIAGLAAAAVILAYSLAVDIGLLQIFWNPLLIMLPVALMLVAAACVDGWSGPIGLTAIAATFAVQSSVSAAPVVVAAVVCALVWFARESRPVRLRSAALGLGAIAVLAWVPPLIQQLTAKTGNFGRLWLFFRSSGEPQPGWGNAVAFAGRELAVFPSRIIWKGTLTSDTVSQHLGELALVLFIAFAGALVIVARKVGTRLQFRLGVVSLVGAFVAVYAMASVRGPVYWYVGAYLSAIAVPLLLGWLLFVTRILPVWGPRLIVAGLSALTLVAVVSATTTPVDDNRAFPNEDTYRANTEAAWRVIRPIVSDYAEHRTVALSGDPALTPTIAGVALKIERFGVRVFVSSALVPWFGPERLARRGLARISITSGSVPAGSKLVGYARSRILGSSRVIISIEQGAQERPAA